MDDQIYKNITNSTAHRSSRLANVTIILNDPTLLCDLVTLSFNTLDCNHHKATWILEMIIDTQPHLLTDHLDFFCQNINKFKNESAIRSAAKTCLHISRHLTLSSKQQNLITENCLDWLITTNRKVATKAYAIRTLYELGKEIRWIHPELKEILIQDYPTHSSAYKAVAREILKKIK
ncbi:hypothetical protein [Flavobacterium sp. 14A]|uniref:hypothetical protein n=1 Tax=Flavobacterium sp. 14A TaxID=2735896 RepID=UPI00156F241F|nr:hypothetical protein [Flavobacterium sp. 14A]NRT10893.1 hypothetical protein [Flavobacterium sp. 14A]